MKGKFIVNGKVWDNHIMDQGVKKMMRILADIAETDKLLIAMSVGTSDTDPDDTTKTALIAEVGTGKYTIGSHSVNTVFPFDLELNITIPADDINGGTVLKEVGIWFGPVASEFLFARAVDPTGITVVASMAVPVKYDLNIV